MGVHPWPSLTIQDTSALAWQDPASQEKTGQHGWRDVSHLVTQNLTSLCVVEVWGVTHLTFEDESMNLGQLSTWEPPGFRLWLMYAYYPSREYCYQNSGFPYLLFLYSDHCWIMHPSHTTYSVSFHDGQYICFNLINHPWEQWLEVQSFTSGLVNHTQVNDPNKPVSIYFDVCAAIAKNTGP
jgi:hypothetical protein